MKLLWINEIMNIPQTNNQINDSTKHGTILCGKCKRNFKNFRGLIYRGFTSIFEFKTLYKNLCLSRYSSKNFEVKNVLEINKNILIAARENEFRKMKKNHSRLPHYKKRGISWFCSIYNHFLILVTFA